MNPNRNLKLILILLITFPITTFKFSCALETKSMSELLNIDLFLSEIYRWGAQHSQSEDIKLELSTPFVLAGVLSFVAASISSAGGIGGGGLFIPILTIVGGLNLKTASSFSAFMVTGGSIANVLCHMFPSSSKHGGKRLIDYDIALLSQPCILLGVSIGVICNLVLPEWLTTIWFAIFLAWCTSKTCRSGVLHWKKESEELRSNGYNLENGALIDETCDGNEGGIKSAEVPLLGGGANCSWDTPWLKLGVLIIIWFSFLLLYLLRGNSSGKGIIPIEACGVAYWTISAMQIPLAIICTSWIVFNRDSSQIDKASNHQEIGRKTKNPASDTLIFPVMALLAGLLGGVFGIGGGMLISPLLLQVGIAPEVTSATCSFMVFFSSSMSAIQYLLLGMEHVYGALIFAIICFIASIVGLVVIQRAIEKHGRASIIVFLVGIVMALSTVLMTSFGAIDVWEDYSTGKYMGFKKPC